MKKLSALLGIILLVLIPGSARGQNLSGTYGYFDREVRLELVIHQDALGTISGTLSSEAGFTFRLEGIVQDGVGIGTCYSKEGGVFFEAHPRGNQLLFAMIEPGSDSMPDYEKVRQFLFVKKEASPAGSTNKKESLPESGANGTAPPKEADKQSSQPASPEISREDVGDLNWGFAFHPPEGWKWRKNYEGVILGHDTIPGMILVFPHRAASLAEVRSQMMDGLVEEGIQLTPAGRIQKLTESILAGNYHGIVEGQQARARGVGTISPHGGGAFIIAMTLPDKFGKEHSAAAETIAKNMRYFKVEVSDLAAHFTGTWRGYTGGYGGGTLRNFTLAPDGSFHEASETSYSSDYSSDGWSHNDAHMDATGTGSSRGSWTIRGNRREGVIVISYPNGTERSMSYRVHVEKGKTYWNEYWFDGIHYSKKR